MTRKYRHEDVENKWKKEWKKKGIIKIDLKKAKKPFYNLMMFPYPSAEGLHVGNMYAFTGADVYGRYNSMLGSDVFEPIGLDGFGIHSENYAIKIGKHPKKHAASSEKKFYKQLSDIGNMFSWENKLETYDPEYYKWTQWIFTQMFKSGLAYKDKAWVNWCPSCLTVLADEQVESGVCERCKAKVERKQMESWFFKITKYADRLLENIDGKIKDDKKSDKLRPVGKDYDPKKKGLRWPQQIKTAQKSWIGKKEGVEISFCIKGTDKSIDVFTTRLDTVFGTTFIVVSPENAKKYLDIVEDKKNVSEYIKKALSKTEQDRKLQEKEKEGINLGICAINPADGTEIPIFVADYVLVDVGTGALMGVPAHDERDYSFAKKHSLPIEQVIKPKKGKHDFSKEAFTDYGKLVNSGKYSGMESNQAMDIMLKDFEKKKIAKKSKSYHLRDWLISRQRYWGSPIPMLFCEACADKGKGERDDMPGWYCVDEESLPVELPDIKDFRLKNEKGVPLNNAPDAWKYTKCPDCGQKAKRELEVSDTFLDSSWYFLGYLNMKDGSWIKDSLESEGPFDSKVLKKWMPVDAYIGGAEHAVLHLLYSRFVTMVLHDMGHLEFEEPFPFLFTHGLIIKDGSKMSKSKGNVINPDDYIGKFGADVFRLYLMFLGPYEQGGDFSDTGIEGMSRFLDRVWDLYENHLDKAFTEENIDNELQIKMHKTIKKVTTDISKFKYNTAIASIMEFTNILRDLASNGGVDEATRKNVKSLIWNKSLAVLAQMMAPFAPFFAEEIWTNKLGKTFSVHSSSWPAYKNEYIKEKRVTVAVQVNGKLRATLNLDRELATKRKELIKAAKSNKKVTKWLKKGKLKDTIFVAGKLVNFVVK